MKSYSSEFTVISFPVMWYKSEGNIFDLVKL